MCVHAENRERVHDIACAVFRVASLIRQPRLKADVEEAAVEFASRYDTVAVCSLCVGKECAQRFPYIERLKTLVRLAESTGEMKVVNAQVLTRELTNLQSAINAATGGITGNGAEVDISGLFESVVETENVPVIAADFRNGNGGSGLKENELRQSEISDFIRQSTFRQDGLPDGCRMRELVAEFPNVSERTLRNDLLALINQGLIVRTGSQGPLSKYVAVGAVVGMRRSVGAGEAKTSRIETGHEQAIKSVTRREIVTL